MARAVSPWTWAKALRDQGPDDWGFLLVMYTLRTYMGRDGLAFASQAKLAAGARCHVKTVRRHLKRAEELLWLGVGSAQREGRGWRHYVYRACVPDSVLLTDKDTELSGALLATEGEVEVPERGEPIVSPPRPERRDTIVSPPHRQPVHTNGANVGTIDDATWGHSERTWGQSAPNVGTQLEPTKSASEVSLSKLAKQKVSAGAPTVLAEPGLKNGHREAESASARRLPVKARLSSLSNATWLRKMLDAGVTLDVIARNCGSSVTDVRHAIAALTQPEARRSAN